MADELRHITRIKGFTEATVRANLDLGQSAILSDQDEEWVYYNDDASKLYYVANQFHWNGAAIVYEDVDFGEITAHDDILINEYLKLASVTDNYIRLEDNKITVTAGGVDAAWFEDDRVYFPLNIEADGILQVNNKLVFTQDDENEFIDSLDDGYIDYQATTGHRFNTGAVTIDVTLGLANGTTIDNIVAATAYTDTDDCVWTGANIIDYVTSETFLDRDGVDGFLYPRTSGDYFRSAEANYRRYYHLALAAFDPGASGATWTDPDGNTLGGWKLDAAGEVLYAKVDTHDDWDEASDLDLELHFEVNVDNSGGLVTDTVDIKVVFYYKAVGDTAIRTQTVEVATVVGQSPRYKLFVVEIPINYDEVDNVVLQGDQMSMAINLETDTSEVDDIVLTNASFYYHTTHIGIEDGDT